jgi:hypothetical protein
VVADLAVEIRILSDQTWIILIIGINATRSTHVARNGAAGVKTISNAGELNRSF